ncbi:KDR, partial [Cordylochernes scorpioides]
MFVLQPDAIYREVIHRDLAARNVLLADNHVVKICDFGLAKDCYKYSNYVKKGDGPLPIKWMAIESIRDKVFTTKSDVWSFGVFLWEVFSLGGNPYPGVSTVDGLYGQLVRGERMETPPRAPPAVGALMAECWLPEPQDRPDFVALGRRLGELLEGKVRQVYTLLELIAL